MSPVDDALARFRRVAGATAGDTIALDEAALAMSAVLRPRLDVAAGLAELDALAGGCPGPRRDDVVAHLFGSGRFTGDRVTYGSWQSSCLDQVMARGRGIPIALSVLAIEVARRLDVRLVGVGMPAHFLVGDPADDDWFLDPFHDGAVLDRSGCRDLLARATDGRVAWREGHLAPTPPRAIVTRMLDNLRVGFAGRGDRVRLALVLRMREVVAGAVPTDRSTIAARAALN